MRYEFDGPAATGRPRSACLKDRNEDSPRSTESPLFQLLRDLIARHLSGSYSCLSAEQLCLASIAVSFVMVQGKEHQAVKHLRQPVGGMEELHLAMRDC